MRKQLFALAIVLAVSAAFAQQLMNNDALIKMVKAGLSDAIIVATIQSSSGQYNTSPDGLIALKKAGVDDAVLAAASSANHVFNFGVD